MQNHLQVVAKLFEDAGNGTDEEIWTQKFSEFTEKSLAEHATRLKSCETEETKKAEGFRARSSLFRIVQDRIEAQIALIEVADRGPFDTLKALQTAQGSLVEEMISVVAEPPAPAQPPAPAEAAPKAAESGGGGGGLAAALAASRGAAESASPGEFPPLQIDNDDGESPSSPDVPTFGDELMNAANPYDGQMSPSSPKEPNSPSSPNRTEVIREIRYCNSYSQRHLKTKSIASEVPVDGTFCARPPKEGVPLEQLHGVMHALYESKEQQDFQCKEASEPIQTMEQHFYSYLAKRYGRKFAVQEWAHAIFAAVQKYSQKDNGVSVFGKILQNRLAESFPGVLSTLRTTVIQAMRAQLEASQPHMSPAEMQSLWEEFGGDGNMERKSLALLECTQIVSALYNENDSEEIASRLQQKAHTHLAAEKNCVQLRELLQILYVFQTNLTEAFLEDFSKIFNAVDAEPAEGKPCANGVLTHPQLIELVHRLSTIENVSGLSTQDPYCSARLALVEAKKKMHFHFRDLPCATFSQCVDLCGGLINARWSATAAQADSENGA